MDKGKDNGMTLILGKIKISPENKLDVMSDFNSVLEEIKENNVRREREWLRSYMGAFGCYDGYDDEYDDYYDSWYNVDNNKNNKSKKSQRFINGMEVDPDISDDEAYDLYMTGKKHKKRSSKSERRRHIGGSKSSRTFWEEEDDDTSMIDDPRDEEKLITFYRKLNNTADVYVFTSVYDFSEWLEEEGISINESDAYDAVYKDETHCCLDPQSSTRSLICADSYDDLVYYITGGDDDYLAEVSSMAPYI